MGGREILLGAGIAVFILWALLSLIYQFPKARIKGFGFWARLGFLPIWTFFAPRPGTTNYHLLYRDRLPDGTILAWRETHIAPKYWWRVWGDASMREAKAVFDASQFLLKEVRQKSVQGEAETQSILVSNVAYLLFLNYVSAFPHEEGANSVQFLLMQEREGGFSQQPEALFLSGFHPLVSDATQGQRKQVKVGMDQSAESKREEARR